MPSDHPRRRHEKRSASSAPPQRSSRTMRPSPSAASHDVLEPRRAASPDCRHRTAKCARRPGGRARRRHELPAVPCPRNGRPPRSPARASARPRTPRREPPRKQAVPDEPNSPAIRRTSAGPGRPQPSWNTTTWGCARSTLRAAVRPRAAGRGAVWTGRNPISSPGGRGSRSRRLVGQGGSTPSTAPACVAPGAVVVAHDEAGRARSRARSGATGRWVETVPGRPAPRIGPRSSSSTMPRRGLSPAR